MLNKLEREILRDVIRFFCENLRQIYSWNCDFLMLLMMHSSRSYNAHPLTWRQGCQSILLNSKEFSKHALWFTSSFCAGSRLRLILLTTKLPIINRVGKVLYRWPFQQYQLSPGASFFIAQALVYGQPSFKNMFLAASFPDFRPFRDILIQHSSNSVHDISRDLLTLKAFAVFIARFLHAVMTHAVQMSSV